MRAVSTPNLGGLVRQFPQYLLGKRIIFPQGCYKSGEYESGIYKTDWLGRQRKIDVVKMFIALQSAVSAPAGHCTVI
ncbi:hypothetical protein [Candidatus Electrothrix sp.]|uniref:hypothetical protein n=1 Tax=Candidatus Electrothrix sp. TaxID=2170559 RepID=UPI004057C028